MGFFAGLAAGLVIGYFVWASDPALTYDDGVDDGWAEACNAAEHANSELAEALSRHRIC